MKTGDTFHWHIYICSRLFKRCYYSFICRRRFENFIFVMSFQIDAQYYSSSFFYSSVQLLENIFLFCRPFGKHISPLLAQSIVKIISHLPAQPTGWSEYGPWARFGPVWTSSWKISKKNCNNIFVEDKIFKKFHMQNDFQTH